MCNEKGRPVSVEGEPIFVMLYRNQCLTPPPLITTHIVRRLVLVCPLLSGMKSPFHPSFIFLWAFTIYNGARFCIHKTVPGSEAPRWLHVFVKPGLSPVPWKLRSAFRQI